MINVKMISFYVSRINLPIQSQSNDCEKSICDFQ